MKTKAADFTSAFDTFWTHVERAERDIHENGHLGRLPPICHGDPWDDEFAAAYDAVRPYLTKFQKERYYPVPPGLAFRPGPIKAETAHQALMFFLNRPDELHGEKGVLDSTEYKAIKEAAMAELRQRDEVRVAKNRRPPCTMSAKQRSELIELRGFLLDHHFPKGQPFQKRTLTSDEIERAFGWSQSTASRKMGQLFKTRRGMAAYAVVFGTASTPKGYRKRFDDSTLSVEALWIDRTPYDDEGESEEDV